MANSELENRLRSLAQNFVNQVLGAFRDTFSEVVGGSASPATRSSGATATAAARTGRSTKDGRRTPAETLAMAHKLAAFIAGKPAGIRIEPMGKELGLRTNQMTLPLAKALKLGLISKKGQRRSTVYLPGKKSK